MYSLSHVSALCMCICACGRAKSRNVHSRTPFDPELALQLPETQQKASSIHCMIVCFPGEIGLSEGRAPDRFLLTWMFIRSMVQQNTLK